MLLLPYLMPKLNRLTKLKLTIIAAVRQRRGVEGSTAKFPKVGKGVATLRIPQTDVTPLNVDFHK
jgi:hypothetical protein